MNKLLFGKPINKTLVEFKNRIRNEYNNPERYFYNYGSRNIIFIGNHTMFPTLYFHLRKNWRKVYNFIYDKCEMEEFEDDEQLNNNIYDFINNFDTVNNLTFTQFSDKIRNNLDVTQFNEWLKDDENRFNLFYYMYNYSIFGIVKFENGTWVHTNCLYDMTDEEKTEQFP